MSLLRLINMNRPITSYFIIALVLMISLSFTACDSEESDTVDQDKIYTKYLLYYNANEDVTYARAWFQFSDQTGELLELVEPSKVTFNGDDLPWRETLSYYEKQYAGYKGGGTFKWTDTDGNTYTNTISIDTSFGYPANLDTIPRSSSYTFTWTGDTLDKDERVKLTIDGEDDSNFFTQDNQGSSDIILPKDDLEEVGQGTAEWKLDWRKKSALKEATSAGGWIKGRYRPENIDVYMN